MAEIVAVVGIIASVIGIIDGIDKSKTIWKKYFHSSASLRAELLPILGKLTAFAGILRGLQLQCELDEVDDDRLKLLGQIEQPLKASEQAVRLISARLDQVVSLGRVSLSFGKVLNNETTAALHILDQAKPVLDLALAADQRTLVKSIETYVRNVADDVRDARLEGKLHFEDLKGELQDIKAKEAESNQAKVKAEVLAWISQTNYTSNYHAAREPTQHVDASGDWFIAGKDFQEWATGGSCSRLLLTGISGSGKTVLCAKSIEHLARTKTASGASPTILYFFFDFNDAAKESVEGMVRSLLCQLLSPGDEIPHNVRAFYNNHQGTTTAKPSVRTWVDLLSAHLRDLQDVFIFIDALDECNEAETALLRESLAHMLFAPEKTVRWLLTCRPNENATSDLYGAGFNDIFMETGTVDKDIETYLTSSLKADPRLSSFSKAAGDRIITEITIRSSGMFRYAHCQLETLAKLRDRRLKRVQEILRTMPKTISESYQRILSDAERLDDWSIVERILLLVSFSTRPVTIAEVSEFSILEDEMTSLDPEDRFDLSDALATISPLITVRDGYITLAHKSVHDFFAEASEPWTLFNLCQNADTTIAKKCLQYLRFSQEPIASIAEMKTTKRPNTTHLSNLLNNYPFLDYAATRWTHHLPEKQLQEEVVESMVGTLPLTSKPNLWKAWLLLQRADIWETQIQLAAILCESFVRGALVTSWSQHFWQERQDYRIRSDAKAVSKRLLKVSNGVIEPKLFKESAQTEEKSYFWVKASKTQSLSPLGFLRFEKGDLIFIKEKGPGDSWIGCVNGQIGFLSLSDFESCRSNANPRLSGALFHELAVLLLEVAFQTPLCGEAMALWSAASSINKLASYLAQLRELTSQAVRKMGLQYGRIIDECLSNVQWVDESTNAKVVDVLDAQEACMEKVCKPLGAIRSSGFQAARKPVKRSSKFQANPYTIDAPHYGGYISSAASAPYQTTASMEYTSHSTNRLGSAPPGAFGRAMSAEPRWATASATFVSQTAAYYSSPSPAGAYRPNSDNATAVTYSGPASASMIRRPESAPFRPFSSTSPAPGPPLPSAPAMSSTANAGLTFQSSPLTIMETVQENKIVKFASKMTGTESDPSPFMDTILETKEERFTMKISGLANEPKVAMDTISEVEKGARDPLVKPEPEIEDTVSETLRATPDLNATAAAAQASEVEDRFGDATAIGGQPEALSAHDIEVKRLSWDLTDGLSYRPFASQQNRPTDIRVSDDEMNAILESAREAVLYSDDADTQLLWARDALFQVRVAEINRIRTFSQAHRLVNVPYPDDDINRDALSIVNFLAEQGHPDAIYLQARNREEREALTGLKNESLDQFKTVADNGHAAACYRVGLAMYAAGREQESFVYFEKAAAVNSAGALCISGIKTINRRTVPAIKSGMELLFKAAEVADADAPGVLFQLGQIFAHESALFSGSDNPAPMDKKRAVDYFKRAAFFGSAEAQLRLGTAYEMAELDLEFSLSQALHYYILAARRGQSEAEMSISKIMLYLVTSGDDQSEELASAAYIYAKRATLGTQPNALFAVGYYHERGVGVVVDQTVALEWYAKAAQQGSADAREAISRLHGPPSLPERPPPQTTVSPADNGSAKSWRPDDERPVRHETEPVKTVVPPRLPPRPALVAEAAERLGPAAPVDADPMATQQVPSLPRPRPPIPNVMAADTARHAPAAVTNVRPPLPPVRRADVDLALKKSQMVANEVPQEPGSRVSMAVRMKNMLGQKKDEVVGKVEKKVSVRASVGNLGLLNGRKGK